ncbi:MAG: hypothetical protein RMA76_32465 [Deltaproteobacteria bacterium]|jgi:hypothetical protein
MRALAFILCVLFGSPAFAGEVDGSVSTDFFRAEASSDTESFAAQEIGMHVRLRLRELDDKLRVAVDYRGREPVGGAVQNTTLRLLYQAEVGYEIVDGLELSAGRFVAGSASFLPVDAVKAAYRNGRLRFEAFGGRRALTTSRRNVDLSDFLPAVGGGVSWRDTRLSASLVGAFARDRIELLRQDDDTQVTEDFDAFNLMLFGVGRPTDELTIGGNVSFSERASYVLGPSWSSAQLQANALNLLGVVLFADYQPFDWVRVGYQGQFQRAAVFREGLADDLDVLQDPNFLDNRVHAAVQPLELGWVRASARLRIREDRREIRYGASIEANRLGIKGPYLLARIFYDDIEFDDPDGPDLDRILWKGALGFRRFNVDAQAGVRFLERSAAPVSGLAFDPRSPGQPVDPDDLSPFVLQAQQVLFARIFYAHAYFFGGGDFEKNLNGGEIRFFVHAGAQWGATW